VQFDELWHEDNHALLAQIESVAAEQNPQIRGNDQCTPIRASFEAIDIREVN
jgi:hypothetical protein